MPKSTVVSIIENDLPTESDFLDLFSQLEEFDKFDAHMIELAANMSALLSHEDKSRTEICRSMGWSKGRMSYFLKGKTNPTFRSIVDFSTALGYQPDIIFRKKNEARAYQPWQKNHFDVKINKPDIPIVNLRLQSAYEVMIDMISGNTSPNYLSLALAKKEPIARDKPQALGDLTRFNIPINTSASFTYAASGVQI